MYFELLTTEISCLVNECVFFAVVCYCFVASRKIMTKSLENII